ncbi:PH domain-containing protein [Haloparvum alkalitolerans]|uniref:PH domain-containing protein n=1 Tax=Haloparvum alkalitolerans TaxID=1042953 RepID=UPI003CF0FC2B
MRRLHPRIRVVWLLRAAVLAAVVGGILFGLDRVLPLPVAVPGWAPALVAGVVFLVVGGHALLRYRYWRFELREDAIYLERGVFTRVRTVVPFVRIQHVDSRRGPLERVVGLASCVVYSAGSRGADVRIPGLPPDGADDLREDLKRLAIGAEGEDGV